MPWSFELVNKVAAEFKVAEKRDVYTTPKSFLELLGFYKRMLESKRSETDAAINRLATGLTTVLARWHIKSYQKYQAILQKLIFQKLRKL